ncbi:hypothetical protein [Flavobacterium cyanobacteriorum]|nr:hypothetical protein [Flavobacterium cyanobacteriorum]
MTTPDKDQKSGNNGSYHQMRPGTDYAGTDPERYEHLMDDENDTGGTDDDDYKKKPKNHTTTDERLLNLDRGE